MSTRFVVPLKGLDDLLLIKSCVVFSKYSATLLSKIFLLAAFVPSTSSFLASVCDARVLLSYIFSVQIVNKHMIITHSQEASKNIVKPILEIGFKGWVGLPRLLVIIYNRYLWDRRRSGPGI